MIVWRRDRDFFSAARAERAFVDGYELVAFDIPPDAPGQQRIIGWEVWLPKKPDLGSREQYVKRLRELMEDDDAFDELIETLETDRSINREGMRQIASEILGYPVPKSRGRGANLHDIRRRQSSEVRRWADRLKRIGSGPRGLRKGSSASFEEAKQTAEATLMKLLERR